MSDFFWSTQNPSGQDVRCEGGEVVHVDPKSMGAIAADAGNFVWADPTAVQADNIYNNWPDLAKAIAKVRGQKTVTCVAAALTVTAGAWPGITDVTFVTGEAVAATSAVVTVADGATFTSTERITLRSVVFEYAGTAGPCITLTGSTELVFNLKEAGAVGTTGGHPMVSVGDTASLLSFADIACSWGAGTVAIATIGAVASFFLFNGSALQSGAVTATALGTVNIGVDGASQSLLSATAVGTIAPGIQVLDPQPTFVFRPGGTGTLDGNVFTTWAALMEAVSLTAGPRTILVDDSLAAAHMTTVGGGTPWNLDNVTLMGNALASETLIVDVGAKFTSSSLRLSNGLILSVNATATAWTAGVFFELILEDPGTSIQNNVGSAPLLTVAAGGNNGFVQVGPGCVLGDGTHNVITVPATGSIISYLEQAGAVNAHAYAGAGTVTQNYAASLPSLTQDVTTYTLSYSGFANETQATGNTGTGTGTASITSGNITREKSGKVLVIANMAGTTTAGTTVTLQLKRDGTGGTSIGNTIVETTLSAGDGFHGSIAFVDTLPDAAAHTYACVATAGSGNITAGGANSFQITAVEL